VGSPGNTTIAWGALIANANDIVEFDATSGEWFVSFDSQAATTVEYVTNLTTDLQYRFDYVNNVWMKSYEGWYNQGDYSIVI
jgi:hypothetical protein